MPGGDHGKSDPMMGNRTGSSDSNHDKDKDQNKKASEKVRFFVNWRPINRYTFEIVEIENRFIINDNYVWKIAYNQ